MSTAPRHLRRRGQNAARLMIVAGLLALLIGPSARAQSTRGTKGKVPAAASSAPAPANVPSAAETSKLATKPANAEVRKIDKDAGKVTLRHFFFTWPLRPARS